MKTRITKRGYTHIHQKHRDVNFHQYVTEPNWLDLFVTMCSSFTKSELDRHVGPNSTYAGKQLLLDAIKFHYAILSGKLRDVSDEFKLSEDNKTAIIFKLSEEITQCSPGYHGRVNSVLESYFSSKTLAEFFSSIREDVVERAARSISSDVHLHNRYFRLAYEAGFGVLPKLSTDVYRNMGIEIISDEEVIEQLHLAFAIEFQPFSTLLGIKELITSRFEKYQGRKEDGYKNSNYVPGLEALKILFNENETSNEYLIIEDDEESFDVRVVDINWGVVLHKLWTILLAKKYFDFKSFGDRVRSSRFLPFARFFANSIYGEDKYNPALQVATQLFLDPNSVSPNELDKLFYLFASETEFFAYLKCNPNLSLETKLALIFKYLDKVYKENPNYLANSFWEFAADNPSLTEAFTALFISDYQEMFLKMIHNMITNKTFIDELATKASLYKLKGSVLLLRHALPEDFAAIIRASADTAYKFTGCFLHVLSANNTHCGIVLEILELMEKNLTSAQIYAIFIEQKIKLANILSGYSLELMSYLPKYNENYAELGKIYVSPRDPVSYMATYIVRGPDGKVRHGQIGYNINLHHLNSRLDDPELKSDIIAITSSAGHTFSSDKPNPIVMKKAFDLISTFAPYQIYDLLQKDGNVLKQIIRNKPFNPQLCFASLEILSKLYPYQVYSFIFNATDGSFNLLMEIIDKEPFNFELFSKIHQIIKKTLTPQQISSILFYNNYTYYANALRLAMKKAPSALIPLLELVNDDDIFIEIFNNSLSKPHEIHSSNKFMQSFFVSLYSAETASFPQIHSHLFSKSERVQKEILNKARLYSYNDKICCCLFELDIKVTQLANNPKRIKAYIAAKTLQQSLNDSLDKYFKTKETPTQAKETLVMEWNEAINLAMKTLGKYRGWKTFLKNLALVCVSIPLLGIPLLINYCVTGKYVFFQSATRKNLDKLTKEIQYHSHHQLEIETQQSDEKSLRMAIT